MSTREKIVECLKDVGILVDTENNDTNINDYDVDSITFISFIVEIEEVFDIIIPDGYLYSEILKSLNGFTSLVEQLISEKMHTPDEVM